MTLSIRPRRRATDVAIAALLFVGVFVSPTSAQVGSAMPPLLQRGASSGAVRDWLERHIAQDQWYLIDYSDTEALLLSTRRQDVTTYPLIRDWLKWERFASADGTPPRSSIWRVSVNCQMRSSKVDSVIDYSGNNGRGDVVSTLTAKSWEPFEEAAPQTLREAYVNEVCRQADAARARD